MTYEITNTLKKLRDANENTPKKRVTPSKYEIDDFEKRYSIVLPFEYKEFLKQCSDVNYSTLQPGVIIPQGTYYSLDTIMNNGWEMGVEKDKIPFCEDNGDFYCFNENGEIEYWSLDGYSNEKWDSFSHWINEVWLNETD